MKTRVTVSMPPQTFLWETSAVLHKLTVAGLALLAQSGAVMPKVVRVHVRRALKGSSKAVKCIGATDGTTIKLMLSSGSEMVLTLAHELIHVVQFSSGRMLAMQLMTPEGTPYEKLPWEIEALQQEQGLAFQILHRVLKENPTYAKGYRSEVGEFESTFRLMAARIKNLEFTDDGLLRTAMRRAA